MSITLHDRAPLEKVRRLADGRIAAVAKFARSGCYSYAGSEVGRPDLQAVTVYRPESEVFDQAAMASFAHKAITIDHPAGSVTADNWKTHSVGWTEGKVARDGEFVEIPLMLADASAVRAYDAGKRELSAGYTCDLTWGDGIAPDGTRYQATMRTLRGNHIAIVGAGRAGSECRIGDSMNNTTLADAAITAEVARQRSEHDLRFAFMGDRAPTFDEARARFLATSTAQAAEARMARDAIKAATGRAMSDAAYQASATSMNDWRSDPAALSGEAMRNFARDNQF